METRGRVNRVLGNTQAIDLEVSVAKGIDGGGFLPDGWVGANPKAGK
jgi:hypothetical protein